MPSIPEPASDGSTSDGSPPAVPGRPRRIARWAASLSRAGVLYLVHRVPMFRRGRRGAARPDPPDLDRGWIGDAAAVQRAAHGVGPLFHRRYRIAFTDSERTPEEVIDLVRRDLNAVTPRELARFESADGPGAIREVQVGEEYLVRLPGPWNGPVRVVESDETSFTLATLRGHLEAGQICFRALPHPEHDWLIFEIESFARSSSPLFHWLYHRIPLAREMQLHMWASFCERVVELAGGIVMTSVEVDTHTYPPETGAEVAA